jgi:hypothetical protein
VLRHDADNTVGGSWYTIARRRLMLSDWWQLERLSEA